MQHKSPGLLDRAAEMHADVAHPGLGGDSQLFQKVGHPHLWRGFVHDQAHRALRGMHAHIDHAMGKPRVAHRRHGDQQATAQGCGFRFHDCNDVTPSRNTQEGDCTAIAAT